MSLRGRGQGRGRGKHNPELNDQKCSSGRGFRGRGFNQFDLPRRQPFSVASNNLCTNCYNGESVEEECGTPQPVFTPQPKLDLETQRFFESLRRVWNMWKKSENVSRMLQEYFGAVQNPYETAFKVAVTCPDFYQGKPASLSVAVIEEFALFLKKKKEKYTSCLTNSLKMDVFLMFTKQRNSFLTKMAFDTYDLQCDKTMFIEPIKEFIKNQQYKEACQSATYLGLEDFHIEDFVVPLLFQDKLSIAEDYLRTSSRAQVAIAEYFDSLLQGRVNVKIDDVIRRLQIPDLKHEKLQYKPMSKLLLRFIKIFNLPQASCPNLNQKRREGGLHFVIRKRYKFNEIEGECWREMAKEAVFGDEHLEEELVQTVSLHGDIVEAAYFAKEFQIPFHKLPYNVADYLRTGTLFDGNYSPHRVLAEKPELTPKLQLPSGHQVTMVDSDAALRRCADCLASVHVVGLDTEWKPSFCADTESLSLLQISTHHETFLIDIIQLQDSCVWADLSRVLFANFDILKLGFGLTADLLKLKESILLNDVKLTGLGYLDLNLLWRKLMREFNVTLPYKGVESDSVEGLSRLVSLCLGVSLDKSEQFSNWDRRPLRESQMNYAALDAYCLLQVYEVLCSECSNQGVPLPDVINDIMSTSASSTKKPKKKKPSNKVVQEINDKPPPPNRAPMKVKELKVVCDTMLQGLGKHLRTVGVDVEILSNTQNHNVCVALCNQDRRVILTKGVVYDRLHREVPPGMCYRVDKPTAKEQLVEVLTYYNVIVTKDDIFSRCQICNSAEFQKLKPVELKKAIDSSNRSHRVIPNYEIDVAEDDYDDRGFSDNSDYSDDDYPGPPVSSVAVSSAVGQLPPQVANTDTVDEDDEDFYGYNCQTNSGAHIKHESIPKDVFNKVPLFYVCDSCGHCYWDGSHLERILGGRLKNIVAK